MTEYQQQQQQAQQQQQHQMFLLSATTGNYAVRQRVQQLSRELELLATGTGGDNDYGGDEDDEDNNSVLFSSTDEKDDNDDDGSYDQKPPVEFNSEVSTPTTGDMVVGTFPDEEEGADDEMSIDDDDDDDGNDNRIPRCVSPPQLPQHFSPIPVHLSPTPTSSSTKITSIGGGIFRRNRSSSSSSSEQSSAGEGAGGASQSSASALQLFLSMSASSSSLFGNNDDKYDEPTLPLVSALKPSSRRRHVVQQHQPVAMGGKNSKTNCKKTKNTNNNITQQKLPPGIYNNNAEDDGDDGGDNESSTAAAADEGDYQAVLNKLLQDWTATTTKKNKKNNSDIMVGRDIVISSPPDPHDGDTNNNTKKKIKGRRRCQQRRGRGDTTGCVSTACDSATTISGEPVLEGPPSALAIGKEGEAVAEHELSTTEDDTFKKEAKSVVVASSSVPWTRVAATAALAVALGTLGYGLYVNFSTYSSSGGGSSSSSNNHRPSSISSRSSTRSATTAASFSWRTTTTMIPQPWALLSSTLAVAASWIVYRQQRYLEARQPPSSSSSDTNTNNNSDGEQLQKRKQQLQACNTHYRSRIIALQANAKRLQTRAELIETRNQVLIQQRQSMAVAVMESCLSNNTNAEYSTDEAAANDEPWPVRLQRRVAAIPGCVVDAGQLEDFVEAYCYSDESGHRKQGAAAVAAQKLLQPRRRGMKKFGKLVGQRGVSAGGAHLDAMWKASLVSDDVLITKLVREAMDRDSRVFVVTPYRPTGGSRSTRRFVQGRKSPRAPGEDDVNVLPPTLPMLRTGRDRYTEEKKEEDCWSLQSPPNKAHADNRSHHKTVSSLSSPPPVRIVSLGAAKMPIHNASTGMPQTRPTPNAAAAAASSNNNSTSNGSSNSFLSDDGRELIEI